MDAANTATTVARKPKPGKKYFSLDEATRALPYVDRVIRDIQDCYHQVVAMRQRLDHPHPEDDAQQFEREYERSMDHLSNLVDELHQVGVELKDYDMGLVDFPAVHDGREIYLCWHRGEGAIHAWHEVDAGYSGRQDVKALAD